MADGGEGTSLVLLGAGAKALQGVLVRGPDGNRVRAPVCDLDGVTFLESARVIGMTVLGPDSQALDRSTWGLGEALTLAGINREGPLVVGLGGSATVDGGLGLAQGLGLQLEDGQGRRLDGVGTARDLGRVQRLHGDPPLAFQVVQAWADVRTPLVDSIRLYGPQKGVSAEDIAPVADDLAHWADVINRWRQELRQREVPTSVPGGGAAGGLGFALMGLLDARLVPGSRNVARVIDLPQTLRGADVVLTGEGCFDDTSLAGKVVGEVVQIARAMGTAQVGVLAGQATLESPGPPTGPDWVVSCEEGPPEKRWEALAHATVRVARRLLPG